MAISTRVTAPGIIPFSYTQTQVNGQEFNAIGECVSVTNYAAIKSAADGAGEGGNLIGSWISGHPYANGLNWTVVSNSACPYFSWTYAAVHQPSDNTNLW
ncbi:MAG: hypothetical protein ACHQ1H_01620 [Nitrososphaerales archaeon]